MYGSIDIYYWQVRELIQTQLQGITEIIPQTLVDQTAAPHLKLDEEYFQIHRGAGQSFQSLGSTVSDMHGFITSACPSVCLLPQERLVNHKLTHLIE